MSVVNGTGHVPHQATNGLLPRYFAEDAGIKQQPGIAANHSARRQISRHRSFNMAVNNGSEIRPHQSADSGPSLHSQIFELHEAHNAGFSQHAKQARHHCFQAGAQSPLFALLGGDLAYANGKES